MNKLFEFVTNGERTATNQVNEVLAGYWSKVVLSLIDMRMQDMIEYILTAEGVFDALFQHIHNQSICKSSTYPSILH